MVLWTRSLSSHSILVKSSYLSFCVPVPSWKVYLPNLSVSHPPQNILIGSAKVSRRGSKQQMCSAELSDVSFCLLQEAGLLRSAHFCYSEFKKEQGRSHCQKPWEKENMKSQKSWYSQGRDTVQNLNFKKPTVPLLKYFMAFLIMYYPHWSLCVE